MEPSVLANDRTILRFIRTQAYGSGARPADLRTAFVAAFIPGPHDVCTVFEKR